MNSKDNYYGHSALSALNKAPEGEIPVGEVGVIGAVDHPPKVNLDELPYSYFQPAATLNIGDAKVIVQSSGLGVYPPIGTVKTGLTRLEEIQSMSLKHLDVTGGKILKTDSPVPKERWKQRKPMYEKKAKKEVKLYPLLGGFTGKQK